MGAMGRGFLSDIEKRLIIYECKKYIKKLSLSDEDMDKLLSIRSIRLIPYIDYCLTNFGTLNLKRINEEEKDILKFYEDKFCIVVRSIDEDSEVYITTNEYFYKIMCCIKYYAYVID